METRADIARRAHAILTQAMDLDAGSRAAFAREQCGLEPELLEEVTALLRAAEQADAFLETPVLSSPGAEEEPLPDAVGTYLVVGVLGSGGMATVYEAIQEHPKRRVALKVLNRSMADREAYLRFRLETELLARLQHPGIAAIYEAGVARIGHEHPRPFFAMELIADALPLTEYVRRRGLGLPEVLRMFVQVADAVHHGHRQGIIHRDLKPANVLVGTDGRPRVIDFGVARTTEAGAASLTNISDVRSLIGTLNYMSPEQCSGSGAIDSRADVYALGVMLYELVVGRPPYELSGRPLPAAMREIMDGSPPAPRTVNAQVPRDLEAIICKAMAKSADRRYDSASAFSADVQRFLRHQPVEARSPGVLDQCLLFARRHRALVASGLALAASLLALAIVSSVFVVRLTDEVGRRRAAETRATGERDEARWKAYIAQISGALSAMNSGEFEQMRTRLTEAAGYSHQWEWGFLSRLAERSVTTRIGHDSMILGFDADADWSRVATTGSDGSVRLWSADGLNLLASNESGSGNRAFVCRFSPDGSTLAVGYEDGVVRLLDSSTLSDLETLTQVNAAVYDVAWLTPQRLLVAGADGRAVIVDLAPRLELEVFSDQNAGVQGIERGPGGRLLATFNQRGEIWVRRSEDFSVVARLEFPGAVNEVHFSDDGRWLAAAGASGSVVIWRSADWQLEKTIVVIGGIGTVRSLAFSRDGERVVAGLTHRGIVVCSVIDGGVIGEIGGHTEAVSGLRFSPDDSTLISSSWDRTVRSWSASEYDASMPGEVVGRHGGYVQGVAFSPDGSMVASASRDGSVRLWDPDASRPIAAFGAGFALHAVAFSPDGRRIAAGGDGGVVRIWHAWTGEEQATFRVNDARIFAVAFDPTGQYLATGNWLGEVVVWNLVGGAIEAQFHAHDQHINAVCFSPDGRALATASRDKSAVVWDWRTGEPVQKLVGHASDVFAVLFSGDGSLVYTGSRDQSVKVWNASEGRMLDSLEGHGQFVTSLAFNHDETRLAAASWFGQVLLFDVPSRDLIASFRAHEAAIRGVGFSPGGRWLVTGAYDATVRLYDSASRAEAEAARGRADAAWLEAERRLDALLGADSDGLATIAAGMAEGDAPPDPWLHKAVLHRLAPPISEDGEQ